MTKVSGGTLRLAALGLLMLATSPAMLATTSAIADEPSLAGVWEQIDENTGRVGAFITMRERKGVWEGYITKMFPKPGDPIDPVCTGCTGDRKDKPVLGIRLIQNLTRHGLTYDGGTILDPRDGSEYDVELTLSPDGQTLTVRGYVGLTLFGHSLEWKRLTEADRIKLEGDRAKPPAKTQGNNG